MTPGKVIHQNDICQLIQYKATTETVLKRPLLIVPPWINKFYILDLDAGEILHPLVRRPGPHRLRRLLGQSRPAPGEEELRRTTCARASSNPSTSSARSPANAQVNAVGYCVGGTLLSIALAYAAAKGDTRIASATLFATQVDFSQAGDLKVFVDEEQIAAVEKKMDVRGYLEGRNMHAAFNMLRPDDLIWPYVIANYFKGEQPAPFDLLYWNSDTTRMPAANHSFYLRNCYLDNQLSKGEMEIDGVDARPRQGHDPDLQPRHARGPHRPARARSSSARRFFGGKVTYVLAGSGHIAGVVNPPARNKYQYWTGPAPKGDFDSWTRKGQGASRLVVALLAEMDREARQEPGPGPPDRQPQIQADRGRAGQLRPRQGVTSRA